MTTNVVHAGHSRKPTAAQISKKIKEKKERVREKKKKKQYTHTQTFHSHAYIEEKMSKCWVIQ